MKQVLYVILMDCYTDLGEGYTSSDCDTFMGIVNDFDTARNIIEYLVDHAIGEENPDYIHCNGCQKSYCGDCTYNSDNHAEILDDDWNQIQIAFPDIFGTETSYHFKRIEVEL